MLSSYSIDTQINRDGTTSVSENTVTYTYDASNKIIAAEGVSNFNGEAKDINGYTIVTNNRVEYMYDELGNFTGNGAKGYTNPLKPGDTKNVKKSWNYGEATPTDLFSSPGHTVPQAEETIYKDKVDPPQSPYEDDPNETDSFTGWYDKDTIDLCISNDNDGMITIPIAITYAIFNNPNSHWKNNSGWQWHTQANGWVWVESYSHTWKANNAPWTHGDTWQGKNGAESLTIIKLKDGNYTAENLGITPTAFSQLSGSQMSLPEITTQWIYVYNHSKDGSSIIVLIRNVKSGQLINKVRGLRGILDCRRQDEVRTSI